MNDSVTAFAPASIGNLGVGFDMLGLALAGIGDRVEARRIDEPGISVAEVRGLDGEPHPYLSTDPDHNTASISAKALWNDYGDSGGIELRIYKGVPLQSGMGSSAASAVAAAFAVNELLGTPLPVERLLSYALAGEQYASGGLHADNVAPSLMGGMIFCSARMSLKRFNKPLPLSCVALLKDCPPACWSSNPSKAWVQRHEKTSRSGRHSWPRSDCTPLPESVRLWPRVWLP